MTEESRLRGAPGDRLVVRGHHQGEQQRDGEILKVLGDDGAPPYLVRWDDGHESEVFPGSDIFIQHFGDKEDESPMSDPTITLTLSKEDAEVLLGVLSSERHNADAEAVCDSVREQLDQKLAEVG